MQSMRRTSWIPNQNKETNSTLDSTMLEDEPLPRRSAAAAPAEGAVPAEFSLEDLVTFTLKSQTPDFAAASSGKVACIAKVEAKELPSSAENARPGIDLVCVIDKSGSMQGEKIQHVCHSLRFVTQELTEKDRLSIVRFDNYSDCVLPLVVMNETGKQRASDVIDSHCGLASGGTNILAGVNVALKLLHARRERNPVTAIIVLSDGQDGTTNPYLHDATLEGGYKVHTFGYGADHDANRMQSIAQASEGSFFFVEQPDMVAEAFADALGSLVGVVAKDISVVLSVPDEARAICQLGTIYSAPASSNRPAHNPSPSSANLPDLQEGSSKSLVFEIDLSPITDPSQSSIVVVEAQCGFSHSPPGDDRPQPVRVVLRAQLRLERPAAASGIIDATVLSQYMRVLTTDKLAAADKKAEAGDFEGAKNTYELALARLNGCPAEVKENPLMQALVKNVEDCKQRCRSRDEYEAAGGSAFVKSSWMQHMTEQSSAVNAVYRNSKTSERATQSKKVSAAYPSSSSKPSASANRSPSPPSPSWNTMQQQVVEQVEHEAPTRRKSLFESFTSLFKSSSSSK